MATFTANVVVDCQHVPPSGAAILRITATPEHDGVRTSAFPDRAVDGTTCLGQSAVAVPIQTHLMADANVPGETALPVRLVAELETSDVLTPDPVTHDLTIEAKAFLVCHVMAPAAVKTASPGLPVHFDLTVRNQGNTRANIQFALSEADPSGGSQAPSQITLESAAQGGTRTQQTVQATLHAPPDEGSERAYRIDATAASTKDPTQQRPCGQVNFLVRSESTLLEKSAPASPALPIALVGLAALSLRRRP